MALFNVATLVFFVLSLLYHQMNTINNRLFVNNISNEMLLVKKTWPNLMEEKSLSCTLSYLPSFYPTRQYFLCCVLFRTFLFIFERD